MFYSFFFYRNLNYTQINISLQTQSRHAHKKVDPTQARQNGNSSESSNSKLYNNTV